MEHKAKYPIYIPKAILYFKASQDPALKLTNKATIKLITAITTYIIIKMVLTISYPSLYIAGIF